VTTEDQAVIERRERLRKRAASLQPEYPACFDGADQYREWRAETRHSSPGANGYCADCSPKDQALMIREGRCAWPGTTFQLDAQGQWEGLRPGQHSRRKKVED